MFSDTTVYRSKRKLYMIPDYTVLARALENKITTEPELFVKISASKICIYVLPNCLFPYVGRVKLPSSDLKLSRPGD